jgi:hypothetical protein
MCYRRRQLLSTQRLLQIRDQIIDVLYADRQAHQRRMSFPHALGGNPLFLFV